MESRAVLLKLIRVAMGWEKDFTLPSDVMWSVVLNLARQQGVEAIAMDGYESLLQHNAGLIPFYEGESNARLQHRVAGAILSTEHSYQKQLSALIELSALLSKGNVPFMIMKGFACGQYYPIPSHRGCGDIDIYPGTRFEDSTEVLSNEGIKSDLHYYRHSVFVVKGVTVENHRVLCDLRGPGKQVRALEKQLEEEAQNCLNHAQKVVIEGRVIENAVFPSADFNALFLPWHASAHFGFERITLRHLLDWALFLTHEGTKIDVANFREAKKKYTFGYGRLADLLTAMALKYLNMPVKGIDPAIVSDARKQDDALVDRVFDYFFEGIPRQRDANVWRFRANNLRSIWRERWKYRPIYGMGVLSFVYYKTKGVIFKVGEGDE